MGRRFSPQPKEYSRKSYHPGRGRLKLPGMQEAGEGERQPDVNQASEFQIGDSDLHVSGRQVKKSPLSRGAGRPRGGGPRSPI
jgi:hypothetical protein